MNNKKLSVIIVNYRSQRYLVDCLASFFNKLSSQVNLEVIIVNNDEQENLEKVIREFPQIKLVDHKKNIGFGSGVNLGAKVADGQYLWFLNPDSNVQSEEVSNILMALNRSDIGAIGTRLIDQEGTTQAWIAGKKVTLWDVILNNLGIERSKRIWKSVSRKKCDWISGGSFFIKKEIFDSLGGFDENIFMYFEDVDFCRRIQRSGLGIIYWPEFVVKHIGGGSYAWKKEQKSQFYASQDYYFEKHCGRLVAGTIRLLRKVFVR